MTWTAPRTWTTGEVVTASMMNTDVRDNTNHLHQTHGPLSVTPGDFHSDATVGAILAESGSPPDTMGGLIFATGVDRYAEWVGLVPDDWISGGFAVKLHWSQSANDTGNVVWIVRYAFFSPGETVTAAGASLTQTVAANGTLSVYTGPTSMGTTSSPTAGELIRMTVQRDGDAAGDTLNTASAILHLMELEYV